MYIRHLNFGVRIKPVGCTLTGGCLEEWPEGHATLRSNFMGTQRAIQINIPQYLPVYTSYIEISVHMSGR